jgi:signal transduction histidine kinase
MERETVAAEKAATLGEVAATLCHEINNFLEEILSAGQVSLLTLDRNDVREMYAAAGKEKTLEKEIERLSVISKEALKIAGLTNRLQAVARGGSYTTTEYLGDPGWWRCRRRTRRQDRRRRPRVHPRVPEGLPRARGLEVDVAQDETKRSRRRPRATTTSSSPTSRCPAATATRCSRACAAWIPGPR